MQINNSIFQPVANIDNIKGNQAIQAAKSKSTGKATVESQPARKVAEDFVGFFMGEMFKSMDEGNKSEGLGLGGSVEKTFREMTYEEYGKSVARAPGNGITEMVYRSLAQKSAQATYGQ